MARIIKPINTAKRRGLAEKEAISSQGRYEPPHKRIMRLLTESDRAQEMGQWKKAQDLLFEAWEIARSNIETKVL